MDILALFWKWNTVMRAWIEVDLNAIRANYYAARRWAGAGVEVMAVVKADAYGHGLIPVARATIAAGAKWLGVATVGEGVALREAGVRQSICLLCPCDPEDAADVVWYQMTPMVGDQAALAAYADAFLTNAREPETERIQRPDAANSQSLDARDLTTLNERHFGRSSACESWASPASPAPWHSQMISRMRRRMDVHLDIDTGMGRSGIQPAQAVALWLQALYAGLRVSGVGTHFADADNDDETMSGEQEALFNAARAKLRRAGARFEWTHTANSPALLRGQGKRANLARPGLLLYGISPLPPQSLQQSMYQALKTWPALAVKARIAAVRELPSGHGVSYGATYRLTRASRVATVLIGYGDGYPRRLSNAGHMLVHGRRVPILGRVCMDQTVVDVTDIPGAAPGDEVVCLGAQGNERITAEELAARIDATPHEITTCLTVRLPRIYKHILSPVQPFQA